MKRGAATLIGAVLYPVAAVAILWLIWALAAHAAASEFVLPRPETTLWVFFNLFRETEVYSAFAATLCRSAVGFLLSLALALALTAVGSAFPPARKLLSPYVSICRAVPTMAVVLLLIIWLGSSAAPAVVSLLVVFPTLYSAFVAAVAAVDRDVIDTAKLDGAGKTELALRFYLPLALPYAAPSAAGALSLSLKLTIAAEVLAGTAGSLGRAMQKADIYYETARLMALTLMAVIVGVVLEKLLYFLLSLAWRKWK